MHNKDPNIYKKARLSTCLTQEAAAEALHLSVESVKAYEAGQRIPPTETVALMADAYDAEWLKLLHLRAAAAPLEILPDKVGALPLANAVLQLVNRAYRFAQADSAHILVDIAEDGVINQAERVEFDRIMGELDGIVAAALSLKCCVSTKKERPDVGASKRSSFHGENRENHRKEIIPHSPGNARKSLCAGKGATFP